MVFSPGNPHFAKINFNTASFYRWISNKNVLQPEPDSPKQLTGEVKSLEEQHPDEQNASKRASLDRLVHPCSTLRVTPGDILPPDLQFLPSCSEDVLEVNLQALPNCEAAGIEVPECCQLRTTYKMG